MSHQAFVDFYSNYLEGPKGADARAKLDGITDHNAISEKMVEVGTAAGFKFTKDDVMAVMEASEANAAKALAQASGELSEDELDSVVGGMAMSFSGVPTVQIGPLMLGPSLKLPGGTQSSTVMCPW